MSKITKPTFTPYQTLFYGCGTSYPHCKKDCYWYKEEPHMGAHIPYCQNKGGNFIEPKDCENCEQYHSKYKPTNADKIRAMTDEELAEWLWFKIGKCPPFDVCPSQCIPCEAKDCWLDWLKKEN